MNDLVAYKTELVDILHRLISADQKGQSINSVKLGKQINLMEESIFRVDHQINKKPLVTNSLYVESNDNADLCMDCKFCEAKFCSFRKHRINRQYGCCPEFEEQE